jgi:hypothetical protein
MGQGNGVARHRAKDFLQVASHDLLVVSIWFSYSPYKERRARTFIEWA